MIFFPNDQKNELDSVLYDKICCNHFYMYILLIILFFTKKENIIVSARPKGSLSLRLRDPQGLADTITYQIVHSVIVANNGNLHRENLRLDRENTGKTQGI